MRIFAGFALALAASVAALPVRASEPPQYAQPGHWSCLLLQAQGPVYMTALFDLQAWPDQIGNAFEQFLMAKYGAKGKPSCSMAYLSGSTLAKLRADQKSYAAQLRQAGRTVVETGWVYDPATATLPYFCYAGAKVSESGQIKNYLYMTHPFTVAGTAAGKLDAAWLAYFKAQHPGIYPVQQDCAILPADPAARPAYMNRYADRWRASGAEIVTVDWKP